MTKYALLVSMLAICLLLLAGTEIDPNDKLLLIAFGFLLLGFKDIVLCSIAEGGIPEC